MAVATETPAAPPVAPEEAGEPARALPGWTRTLAVTTLRSLVPVVLALLAGAVLLLILGRSPVRFYSDVFRYGIQMNNWQNSAVLMAPLLLMAAALVVVFRANIWNLGYDAQYLLGAVFVVGYGPWMFAHWPTPVADVVLFLIAGTAGAIWTIVPALLRAYFGTNEIITTLMMSFIGIDVANILVKGPFQDPTVTIPQTKTIPYADMLPNIPGTRIHVGFLVAIGVVLVLHYLLTRTSFGLRLKVFGENPKAARHVGIDVRRLIVTSFLWSGFLIGLSAAVDILGLWSYVRANWNPSYGNTVIPFVFLARLNLLAVIPFVAFYAVLSTGGDLATQAVSLPTDFLLVIVALILLFMAVIEFLGRRRALGQSYLTKGLKDALRQPLFRRRKST
ncbi:MAG: ABC transporter permease [Actinomycetota bacterium]|nr:ABC transporter permease [Actinomycetota bacterium]